MWDSMRQAIKKTFSCHCLVIIPVSHLAGRPTRDPAQSVFVSHSRVNKQLAFGPGVGWLANQAL